MRLRATNRFPSPQLLVLIIAGLGLISLISFRLLAKGITISVLALAVAIVGLLIFVRPQLGLYTVIVCAAVVRVTVGTGTGSAIVASLGVATLLCLCWIAHRVMHKERLNYLPKQIAIPGLMTIFFTFFSLLWGRATLDPRIAMPETFIRVQLAASALFVVSIGLLFIGADLLRERRARNWIIGGIIGLGLVALPFRILGVNMPLLGVAGLFGMWFIVLCWSQALANDALPSALRWLLGVAAIAWLVVQLLLQRDWTSGWLPPLFALLLVTIILRPRQGWPLLGVVLVLAISFQSLLMDLVSSEEEQGSLGGDFGRFELWARNIELLKDHLLFGTGPAGYALYYVSLSPDKAMSTHNNYIDIIAETGIFGLLSFLVLLSALGWLAWRTLPRLTNGSDRAACAAATGGLVAIIQAMTLGDWVIPFVYNQTIAGFDHSVYTWLMFALLCGLWAQLRDPVSNYA